MKAFLDSNVLVYAFSQEARGERARSLLALEPSIAVQSLNEFTLVARRRLGFDWTRIATALAQIRQLCSDPRPLTLDVHEMGIAVAERYKIGIFDSMIVAAALAADCDTLWSEDMHDGLVVERRLTIRNPFTA